MKIFSKWLLVAVVAGMFVGGSKKEISGDDQGKGMVTLLIKFDNRVGKQDLELNTKQYSNASGESFSISQLQYFVSNIKFRHTDGKEYIINQDESYFLIQENEPSTQIVKLKVPAGDYNQLTFVFGVDSLRNTMNISKRTGVLDPASSMDNGMYWSWNSGYIFFKMEGESPAAPADPIGNHKFRYHIGGFGGYSAPTINNIKTVTIDLSQSGIIKARKNKKPAITVGADILKIFNATTSVSIATHPSIMFSEYSVNIANNYSKMFAHLRTEN
ncbi:MAG: MbnP family protein [Chitinophagaceae bacterium]